MAQATSQVTRLHHAVKAGDLGAMRALLEVDSALANARSETDARGVYPLHVAAEFDQAQAARLLIEHGADPALLDAENDATALCWAAFYGRPAVVSALPDAGINSRNKHGLTPLGCALGGTQGHWQRFSNASTDDWRKITEMLRARGGVE
jgi:ankyrin repeat protein